MHHYHSQNRPRALVGTLYSGEQDYPYCQESIVGQVAVDVEHFVISHRPNKEAHEALYTTFMNRSSDADLFVKVDADMVICKSDLFSRLASILQTKPSIDMIRVPVRDFFTGYEIAGLNAFRSSVRWDKPRDSIFVDNKPVSKDRIYTAKELAPAADHCFYCSEFHAFHFGVHRGVKMRTSLQDKSKRLRASFHIQNYRNVWSNTQRKGTDKRLWLACIGLEKALAGEFDIGHVSYTDQRLREFFDQHLKYAGHVQLSKYAIKLRRRSLINAVRWSYWRSAVWADLKRFLRNCYSLNSN